MTTDRRTRWILLLALAGLLAALVPFVGREFSYAAVWEETQHLQSAASFARDGFLAHRFAPYTQISPPDATPEAYRPYYTRTEPLSFLLFGWLAARGLDSVLVWRTLSLLLTCAGVFAAYAMFRAGGVEARLSAWATVTLAWTPALAVFANSYVLLYAAMPLCSYGGAALWLRRRAGRGTPGEAAALWALLFFQGLATQHTYMMTTQLFFWLWALMERRWSWREAALWLTPHVAALVLLVGRNAWLLGGLGPAIVDDILTKLLWRSVNLPLGAAATDSFPFDMARWARTLWKDVRWSAGLPALVAAGGFLVARARGAAGSVAPPVRRMALALLVPAAFYAGVFPQDVSIHYFHSRNLMAGFALLAACGALAWLGGARRPAAAAVVCGVALATQLAYAGSKLAMAQPWVADAKRIAARLAERDDLVLGSTTDWYPALFLLRKPYVFPTSRRGGVAIHHWWRISDAEDASELRRQVRSTWPGRTLGLVLRPRGRDSRRVAEGLRARGWRPGWAEEFVEVWLPPDPDGPDGRMGGAVPAPDRLRYTGGPCESPRFPWSSAFTTRKRVCLR